MVKLNRLKIITGFKGGVGKTLTALSLLISEIRNNAKILAVDCNANNQDLTDILTNMYDEDRKSIKNYMRWEFLIDDTKKKLVAIAPIESQWSGIDLWGFINQLLLNEKNTASVGIVDTHLSITHFSAPQWKVDDLELETYFIWNLASPDKKDEIKKIIKSIKNLEDAFKKYKASNQIHIFNPHEARSPRTYFSRSLRKRWEKNQHQKKGVAISIETIVRIIKEVNIEFDYKTEITPSRIFEPWNLFFEEILKVAKKRAVLNILPIFQFFDLSNFTTGQIYSKNRNIRGIQEDIGDYYKYINNFNNMRNRLLKK
jgi:hypothetical protein